MRIILGVLFAVCLAWGASAAHAQGQGRLTVFDGVVVDAQDQPAANRLVVVFLNSREVGRAPTSCGGGACRFEILALDEYGVGDVGPDGLAYVHLNLKVGQPEVIPVQAPGSGRRSNYAVMALNQPADQLPDVMQTGRLGLLPDSSVAVIEPTRPPQLTRPAGGAGRAPGVAAVRGFPLLEMALLALACCGTLLALPVLGALVWVAARRV